MTPGTPARSTVSESWSRAVPSWAMCGFERGLGRAVGLLGLIMLPLGREALGEQRLLALVGGCRSDGARPRRPDGGLGGGERRLLLLRVESGQHLVGRHVVADIDQALDDPARDPKGQIALDLRADLARQPNRRRIVGQGDRLDLHHGRKALRLARLLLAGSQTQGDHERQACWGKAMGVCKGAGDHRSSRLFTLQGCEIVARGLRRRRKHTGTGLLPVASEPPIRTAEFQAVDGAGEQADNPCLLSICTCKSIRLYSQYEIRRIVQRMANGENRYGSQGGDRAG